MTAATWIVIGYRCCILGRVIAGAIFCIAIKKGTLHFFDQKLPCPLASPTLYSTPYQTSCRCHVTVIPTWVLKMAAKRKFSARDSPESPKDAGDQEEFYLDVRCDMICCLVELWAYRITITILLIRAVNIVRIIARCSKLLEYCFASSYSAGLSCATVKRG